MTTTEPAWLQLRSIALHSPSDPPLPLWPDGASDEYAAARTELLAAERALLDEVKEVARLRSALPAGAPVADHELMSPDGPTKLSQLFGDHETLLVYHLMFHPDDDQSCAMCALWVDGLHGVSHHLRQRTAFVVVGKAPIDKLQRWAEHRGWHGLRMLSSFGSSFNADLRAEAAGGGQHPTVSVLRREDPGIRHVYTQRVDFPDGTGNGIDLLSPVWHAFDLLPQGRGENWYPDNDYPGAARG